ncbi:MAG: hypothetical protein AB7S26_22760 [Sandaracinaceae bacterium]
MRSATMRSVTLRSVALLSRAAEGHARALLQPDFRLGLAIPLGGTEGLARFAFLASRVVTSAPDTDAKDADADYDEPMLLAPRFVLTFAAADGRLVDIRRTTPSDFTIGVGEREPLGPVRAEALRADERRLTARARVEQAVDRLAPAFFGLEEPPTDELATFAASFREAHPVASEAPLLAFERAIGRRFFAWIEQYALTSSESSEPTDDAR